MLTFYFIQPAIAYITCSLSWKSWLRGVYSELFTWTHLKHTWDHIVLCAIWYRWTCPALTDRLALNLPILEGWNRKGLSWAYVSVACDWVDYDWKYVAEEGDKGSERLATDQSGWLQKCCKRCVAGKVDDKGGETLAGLRAVASVDILS